MIPPRLHSSIRVLAMSHSLTRALRFDAVCAGATLCMVLICPGNATAQGPSEVEAMEQAVNTAALLPDPPFLRREAFTYVRENRRDPFSPPGVMMTGSPMVGGVRLLGIIHHPQDDLSVVLLESRMQSENASGAEPGGVHLPEGIRLRVGDSVGDTRIAQIHVDHVVVEIGSSSGVTRRIVEMPKAEGEAGS